MMAFEFLGGNVHCGRPWHEYGAPYALTDCIDHTAGCGAVLENVLFGDPARCHDPMRLADVQGLAALRVADARAELLPLARARLDGRPAGVREPLRGEPGALRDLPAQAELVRRDDLGAAPEPRHPRDAGLHRRPGRRPGQGLLPDRHRPVRGPAGDQPGQARGGARDRGVRAVRLPAVQRPAALRPCPDRPRAGRGVRLRGAPDGADQQVRQRPGRRCRRQRVRRAWS